MTTVVLAAVVLGGASFMLWGGIGAFRLLHEHAARGRGALWIPPAVVLLCLAGALVLDGATRLSFAATGELLEASGGSATLRADVLGLLAFHLVPLGALVTAYAAARVFAIRRIAAGAVVLGAPYWLLAVVGAQPAFAPALPVPWPTSLAIVMLALAVGGAGLGVVLARAPARRAAADVPAARRLTPRDVAVLVAARNEEQSLPSCLGSLAPQVPRHNIFIGSDGSTDRTVEVAKAWGCNVLDIQPNGGKAMALQRLIDEFAICDRFEAVLIADADAQPDPDYLEQALPLFDDPQVVAVAGHAIPRWCAHWIPRWSMFFAAYRTRLYRVLQAILRYGQTWRHANVSYIVPGFSSLYRTRVLPHLDLAAPGLAVEDYNMTFAIHHHRLGRIAYTPRARSVSQEAYWFRDYWKQVRRWYLGFWQTVRRHGLWMSGFWCSLAVLIAEMIVQSVVFIALPLALAWFAIGGDALTLAVPLAGELELTAVDVAIGVFVVDYATTAVVAVSDRKPILLFYGFGFVVLRWVDSFLFLITLPRAFLSESDGSWVSPRRI
jgi:poly-beta-1,6-N-acetyl-D-glucosamine synthase